jgi:hypothetical protein
MLSLGQLIRSSLIQLSVLHISTLVYDITSCAKLPNKKERTI